MSKDRANAAEELGDEDGGVALRLGAVDPLQRRGANMRGRGREREARAERGPRAGVRGVCGARRAELLSVWMVRCVRWEQGIRTP